MADFLFANTKPSSAPKRPGEGKTHSEPKRPKSEVPTKSSSTKPHKPLNAHHKPTDSHHKQRDGHHKPHGGHHKPTDAHHKPHGGHHKPTDGHHKPTSAKHPHNDVKKAHKHSSSEGAKRTHLVKAKRPVISDSDDDSDHIDGNLFSTRKAPELPSKPHPPPQVKTEVKREVQVGEVRPPIASPVREKVSKSDGAVKSAKQELKVVVKRSHTSSFKPAATAPKEEPMETPPAAQPPSSKLRQEAPQLSPLAAAGAGKKRPPLEAEDEESSSSEEDEDEEGSFDEEPSAQGLDEDESDYEGPSSDDEEFKEKRTPKSAAKSKKLPLPSARSVKKESKPAKGAEGKKAEVKLVPAKRQHAKKDTASKGEGSPQKKRRKEEEKKEVWKWWEEERLPEGVKWRTLEHSGPSFPPPYQPLPQDVKFYYDGQPMPLEPAAEEVAGFFAKMLDHEYTSKEIFVKNFWSDWRKVMTPAEAKMIRDFAKCDFSAMHRYFKECSEARKQLSKEEKLKIKEENERLIEEYGWAIMDGHRERIGNFKIEPPGLFRGRGDHPKQGMIKKRVQAEDITINIGQEAKVPVPPAGHRWKAVIHDSSVTWLASWTENVQGQIKYVMLNPTSRLKGEKDWMKYETARKLKGVVGQIRKQYSEDLKNKEMKVRQRATALYFIDKLALRAGNEKDTDEAADTVGCCSLRVEHITLHDTLDGEECVVEFDFLGKDSIRYQNKVPVDRQVFKNLKLFVKGKKPEDDLFDRLNTSVLNKHLQDLMEGLTAKVFRTFNASNTLQEQLEQLTIATDSVPAQILSYNRANRAVAVLCNHQRTAPKAFQQQMENLQKKIEARRDALADLERELKVAKREAKGGDAKAEKKLETVKKKQQRMQEQLYKLEVQATDKEENKEIALGTSKLNYLDPRISVSWCKKWDIPVEKIYNKTQRQKFAWAIDMADETFVF